MLSENKKDDIYIFGHKSPDTDSICSAIAYAHLKQAQGYENACAYRLGEINQETTFVLSRFGFEKPPLLNDVRLRVGDLQLYTPDGMREDEPVKTAWDILRYAEGSRIIPVISEAGEVRGIIGLNDITKVFMEVTDEDVVQHHDILYKNLISILNGKQIGGSYGYENLTGSLYIGTNFPDDAAVCDKDVVITGKLDMAWRMAYEYDCGCIILTNGISPKGLSDAKCAVVCVDYTMFKTVSLVSQAISI